jgi:TPP-dependent trihydroxycyclohexane-1,2-dione (THcHDO) dehydratase
VMLTEVINIEGREIIMVGDCSYLMVLISSILTRLLMMQKMVSPAGE